jgi:hypothetical protein
MLELLLLGKWPVILGGAQNISWRDPSLCPSIIPHPHQHKMETSTTTLAEYLFTRLHQLGVDSIFGLPGDYNLQLLDYVAPSRLHWIGNCNELNAGYAADGYSRIKGTSARFSASASASSSQSSQSNLLLA